MTLNQASCFKRPWVSITVAMAALSGPAQGQKAHQLNEIVVTAARTAQTVDETLAPITVITREQIEQSQAKSVTDLLRTTPGLQVSDNGGHGSLSSIFFRGTNSNHTLVLVDGVRVNDATGGMPSIPYLNPDQIQRIEIVRGPKSSLYGADAIGGVVQIFTRRGSGDPRLTIKAGGGSRQTSNADLNYGGKINATSFNVNASFFETQGFDRYAPVDPNKNLDGNEDDAYRNKSASINIRHSFDNNSEAGFSVVHNQGKSEYDQGTDEVFVDFNNTIYQTNYLLSVNDMWETRLEVGYSVDDNDNLVKDAFTGNTSSVGRFKTNRKTISWINDIAWSDKQLLTTGADYYHDKVNDGQKYINPDSGQVITTRSNKAFFAQNQSEFDWSDLSIALRVDDNDAYGAHTTGNIAWGFPLPREMTIIASYGTAYRAPTMYELYAPISCYDVCYESNPNLQPEQSQSYELELRGDIASAYWTVSIFQNNIDKLIVNKSIPGTSDFQKANVDKVRIRGVELTLGGSIHGWDLVSNLTFLDPKDLNTEGILLKRARQEFSLSVDRHFGQFFVGADFLARSQTTHWGGEIAPGYGVLDLRAALQIAPSLKVQAKLLNAFDKNYQTTLDYNSEPRGIFATLIWSPEL